MRISIDNTQCLAEYEGNTKEGTVVKCSGCNSNNLIKETLKVKNWILNDTEYPQYCIGCGNELFIPWGSNW